MPAASQFVRHAERGEFAHGMRQQRDADPEFLDLRRAFVNAASDAEPMQIERQRKSANAATDNGDVAFDAHACKPKKRDSRTAEIEQRLVAAGPADEGKPDRTAGYDPDRQS